MSDYKTYPVCGVPCPLNKKGKAIKCRKCPNFKTPIFREEFREAFTKEDV